MSTPAATGPTAARRRVPTAVLASIGLAWAAALAAQAAGRSALFDHDTLTEQVEAGLPLAVALVVFAVGWQVMLTAMMLPSTLPMIRLFVDTSADQQPRRRVLAAFVAGYAEVWTAFGLLAFAGDLLVHEVVEQLAAIETRPWLVGGGVLAVAGAFQFSRLKDRCLDACRHPAAYLLPRYRRGIAAAYRLGRGHGRFCLGCCWALMLVMFAVGVADLRWMAGLGALMAYEKIGRHGRRVARVAGVALLFWAAVVLAHPAWLPGGLTLGGA